MLLQAQVKENTLGFVWSLEDCLEYAATHNLQLLALRKTKELNEQDLLQTKAAWLPNFYGSAGQYFSNSEGVRIQRGNYSNYGVNSTMIVYQDGYLKNNVKANKMVVRNTQLTIDENNNNLSLQIIQGYLNVLLAKENIIILQALLESAQTQYKQGEILFKAGSIARVVFANLEAIVASDHYNLVNAKNQLRLNKLIIRQLLQLPVTVEFDVTVNPEEKIIQVIPELEYAQQSAFEHRPEIENAKLAIEQAELQLKQSRTAFKPVVSLGGILSSSYEDNLGAYYFNQLNTNFYKQLGISMTIPIYTNRINRTALQKSKIVIDQSKLEFEETKIVLSQEVEQAYVAVLNAFEEYKASLVQYKYIQETYRISNEQLRLGAIDMTDFLVQRGLYIQAQQSNIQAKYSLLLSEHIYEFYINGLKNNYSK